jgi:N-acetylmuramic acid 6-phosphate etherase
MKASNVQCPASSAKEEESQEIQEGWGCYSQRMAKDTKLKQERGHLPTEARNPASTQLDAMDTPALLALINQEDAKVHRAVGDALPALAKLVDRVVKGFEEGGRLIYLGAGTSGRLGVLDASECPPTFFTDPGMVVGIIAGGDGALRKAAEGAEDDRSGAAKEFSRLHLTSADVVVGIAAGGTTPYVWGALEMAKKAGSATGLVTCVKMKDIKEDHTLVDHAVELLVGPEVVTGSTRMKAGSATKLALNMITTGAMVKIGKTWGNLMVDLRASNVKLVDRACRIIQSQSQVDRARAEELLTQADGRVKVALVMAIKNVDVREARALLDKHAGRLAGVVGPAK